MNGRPVAFAALVLAGLMAPRLTLAQALDYPHAGILQDTRATTGLFVRCEPPEGSRMTCAFSETRVEAGVSTPLTAGGGLPSDLECRLIEAAAPAFVDGVPPPGVDAEVFAERFSHQPAQQKDEAKALFSAFADYCGKKDGAAARLEEIVTKRGAGTCVLHIRHYDLAFEWNAGSGRWESRSQPGEDDCGSVRVGAFEREASGPANRPWNYRIATEPTRELHGATCPPAPETEQLFGYDLGDVYVGCNYIRFSD